jgi:hypothetical protein
MADKNFIKDNFALIIGLSLPAILVLGFLLASYLPQSFDTPPQYELVFSTSRYDNSLPFHVDFTIINQKLHMRLTPRKELEGTYVKELFVYNAQKGSVRKIHYQLPELSSNHPYEEIPITELHNFIIDSSSKSPDGYAYVAGSYRSRGILGELFGNQSGRNIYRVKKAGGGSFVIPDYGNEFSYGNFNFIGWIVKSEKVGVPSHVQ